MCERPIGLTFQDVKALERDGQAELTRVLKLQPAAGEMPNENPYGPGDRLWGRESVAKSQGKFLYDADGRQPGHYYLKNFYMPRAACRFELEVAESRLEYLAGQWVCMVLVKHLKPAVVYQLDFDQVAEAGFRTRHRATFPLVNMDFATDPALKTSAFVRTHARFHHEAWYLPLYDRDVRGWVRALRFTKAPLVQVGGVEVVCGKEVVLV